MGREGGEAGEGAGAVAGIGAGEVAATGGSPAGEMETRAVLDELLRGLSQDSQTIPCAIARPHMTHCAFIRPPEGTEFTRIPGEPGIGAAALMIEFASDRLRGTFRLEALHAAGCSDRSGDDGQWHRP